MQHVQQQGVQIALQSGILLFRDGCIQQDTLFRYKQEFVQGVNKTLRMFLIGEHREQLLPVLKKLLNKIVRIHILVL